MLVREVMMLLDVGSELINECVPALFVGHIFKTSSAKLLITHIDDILYAVNFSNLSDPSSFLYAVPYPKQWILDSRTWNS